MYRFVGPLARSAAASAGLPSRLAQDCAAQASVRRLAPLFCSPAVRGLRTPPGWARPPSSSSSAASPSPTGPPPPTPPPPHTSASQFSSSVLDSHLQSEEKAEGRTRTEQEAEDKGKALCFPLRQNRAKCLPSSSEMLSRVDSLISSRSYGRLFAVLYINERQWKVTAGDVLMVDDFDIGAHIGQKIVFDKVVLVGGRDFTLLGRPVLPRDLVRVGATVVEKNVSKTNVHLVKWKKLSQAKTYCEFSLDYFLTPVYHCVFSSLF